MKKFFLKKFVLLPFFFFMDFICALLLHSLSFHLAPWPLTCCLIALVVVSIVASLLQSLLALLHHYFGHWFITLFIALFTPSPLHCITVLLARPTFMPFYHDTLLSIWGTFLPPPHLLFFHCLVILCLVASLPCALCVNRYFPFSFFCRWKSLEFGGTSFNQRKIRCFFSIFTFFFVYFFVAFIFYF